MAKSHRVYLRDLDGGISLVLLCNGCKLLALAGELPKCKKRAIEHQKTIERSEPIGCRKPVEQSEPRC